MNPSLVKCKIIVEGCSSEDTVLTNIQICVSSSHRLQYDSVARDILFFRVNLNVVNHQHNTKLLMFDPLT